MANPRNECSDNPLEDAENGLRMTMPGFLVEVDDVLHSGYAYLIHSSLRMPELYPFLGEILFGGRNARLDRNGKLEEWDSGTNLIVLSVDDNRGSLLGAISAPEDKGPDGGYDRSFVDKGLKEKRYRLPRFAAWMDTFGSFEEFEAKLTEIELFDPSDQSPEGFRWLNQSVVGAGNPMSMFRFFRMAGKERSHSRERLNLYLLSSLSNLYRNIGLAETAALLKVMLEGVWRPASGDSGRVSERDGLFFAVLQEGVMGDSEVSYLESFFDGVFRLEPATIGRYRIPRLQVQSLPLHFRLPGSVLYLPVWQHEEAMKNGEFKRLLTEARTDGGRGCFVQTYPCPLTVSLDGRQG